MKKLRIALAIASVLAVPALAEETPVADLPDSGVVTLSGVVDNVGSAREFRLRDKTGFINVNIVSGQSVVLKEGDSVTVNGMVEERFFGLAGKSIDASNVDLHKDLPAALSDAVSEATGLSMKKADAAQIGSLPRQGMVQLKGTVDTVNNEKSFVLRDRTGKIDVNVQSDENVAVTKGAAVTVVGYVNSSLFGKRLRATHVLVTADSTH